MIERSVEPDTGQTEPLGPFDEVAQVLATLRHDMADLLGTTEKKVDRLLGSVDREVAVKEGVQPETNGVKEAMDRDLDLCGKYYRGLVSELRRL